MSGLALSLLAASMAAGSYADVVQQYRAGDAVAAVKAVAMMNTRDFRDPGALTHAWDERALEAAVLLHTETAIYLWSDSDRAQFHIDVAERILDGIAGSEELKRGWYSAVGAFLHGQVALKAAGRHLDRGRKWHPRDAEILLALGSLEETLGSPRVDPSFLHSTGPAFRNAFWLAAQRKLHLERALDYYGQALDSNGRLAEARLRRARVMGQEGHLAEALSELQLAREHTESRFLSYLAWLYSGELLERTESFIEAESAYRNALARCPHAQAASLALSQLLDHLGRRREAGDVLGELFSSGNRTQGDPAWYYDFGQSWRLDAMMDALRARVRP